MRSSILNSRSVRSISRWTPALPLLVTLCLCAGGCTTTPETTDNNVVPPPPRTEPRPTPTILASDTKAANEFRVLLKAADAKVKASRDVHCTLVRREMVNGTLQPEEVLDFKDRFQPHSIRLKWIGDVHKGREIIWVEGANDNKVLVRPEKDGIVGVMGLFNKNLRFALDSPEMKSNSRYPPDHAGYDLLMGKLTSVFAEADGLKLAWVKAYAIEMESGKKVRRFDVTYEPKFLREDISKVSLWFDTGTSLVVRSVEYNGKGQIAEDYRWQDLKLNVGLTDTDFTFEKQP